MHQEMNSICNTLKKKLDGRLSQKGILYRLFSRIKSRESVNKKIESKEYTEEGKKLQDIIGFRITAYFFDDVEILIDYCRSIFKFDSCSRDDHKSEIFKPVRLNYVFNILDEHLEYMESLRKKEDIFKLIDKTFEIQFRTVLSEGWHEVDHLLRYKCADDWNGLFNESRMLNGIYASLETSDRTLKALFEDIAYSHYKTSNWEAMLRNKFLLNFSHDRLDSSLLSLLNSDNEFGRHIIKMNRTQVIKGFVNSPVTFPLSLTNWTHYLNHKYIKNEEFSALTSKRLLEQFNE